MKKLFVLFLVSMAVEAFAGACLVDIVRRPRVVTCDKPIIVNEKNRALIEHFIIFFDVAIAQYTASDGTPVNFFVDKVAYEAGGVGWCVVSINKFSIPLDENLVSDEEMCASLDLKD